MRRIRFACARAILVFVPAILLSQSQPLSSTQATALVSQAIQASTGSVSLTDITLQAQATYIAGSDPETGTATLEATSRDESLVVLNLSGGTRQWLRGWAQGEPAGSLLAGAWTGTDGVEHAVALHNLWTDAAWFFPALTLTQAASDPSAVLVYVGAETKLGIPVEHIQVSQTLPAQPQMAAIIQRLSATDVYLDASSGLPVALDFNVHPDDNAAINIPAEIRYSNYQLVSGMRVPFHIQKYLQGSLVLDLVVSS
ncbi:MAG: hypothetical protein ACRD2B_14470, partial [Terriglobia bacterium]